jgi:hypothetical protein
VSDFIEEVEGQLRSERYRELALRFLPWFAAALVAVVVGWVGVWAYHSWRDRNIGRASIAYDKGLTELSQGDQTGAFTDFAALGASGPAGYRSLALMQQGNIRLGANKYEEAAGFYDRAAKAAPNSIFHDAAELRAALALLDTAPYPQLSTRLTALIGPKKPFDLQAREALAMAKLSAGKVAEARGDLNALTLMLGVSPSMTERAKATIAIIDAGEAGWLSKVAHTAATLPPPSQTSVGPPQSTGGAAAPPAAAGSQAAPGTLAQ